jgi:nucleotide-binding universal stress UspA family protein
MKFKPTNKNGGVIVELGPQEARLPDELSGPVPAPVPAFQLKKILVPVDFSECSTKALQYAIPLAKQFDAELTLLHVVQPYPAVPEMYPVSAESGRDADKELEVLQRTTCDAVASQTCLRVGTPHLEIVRAAKELGADLIVISTHGHTGLAHVFLGSTAERVVRHAGCPVLVVREREHEFVAGAAPTTGD